MCSNSTLWRDRKRQATLLLLASLSWHDVVVPPLAPAHWVHAILPSSFQTSRTCGSFVVSISDCFIIEQSSPYPSFLPVMGAGGINGELRDHSEHVDAIIRTHFNVANGHTFSASSSQPRPSQQSSTNSFNFPEDAAEEMACFSCSSNFTLFKRKVWA